MQLRFTKMHGLGNDFIVVRGAGEMPPELIRRLANRHTGIGFDQLLLLDAADDADIYYRVFNSDGGEVEQCGNGARCIARFIAGDNNTPDRTWRLAYPGGIVEARLLSDGNVAVNMGPPDFEPASLPFTTTGLQVTDNRYRLPVAGTDVEFAVVSMGNPHAVLQVPDVARAPVAQLGPLLERHERFPNRANIGFMQIVARDRIRLRVYERGAGETTACGTGACAAMVTGRRAGLLDADVTVQLPGGELRVGWAGPGAPVWLSGEAVKAFEGVIDI
jgi:diaminopimelate epimerase